ncbi:ribonuclease Z [Jeotgalibacillus marinus]|uniref:Ribonuclease Z n=1 Tax=Jeotgalibacillus marinus TaxID=86667 RepID=A0ABV3PZN9_9BACL
MQLQFLGTGAGVPAKHRNVTSIALKRMNKQGAVWLFDCGEATQQQILYTTIKPRRIEKIFISHLHGDHIYGLPGLLGSRSFQGGTEPLTVYGPKGIEQFVQTTLQVSATYVKYELNVVEIEDGTIIEEDDCTIEVRKLDHGIDSFGYRVKEKDRPGELQVEKLRDLGIPPGPVYQQLKMKRVVECEGKTLNGEDFLGEDKKGLIVTILGDTRLCQSAFELADGADVLIHEATFEQNSEEMAYEYFHSTTSQAALVAKKAGVKELWLTHISSRYTLEDADRLEKEARAIFPNSHVAYDLLETVISSVNEKS